MYVMAQSEEFWKYLLFGKKKKKLKKKKKFSLKSFFFFSIYLLKMNLEVNSNSLEIGKKPTSKPKKEKILCKIIFK